MLFHFALNKIVVTYLEKYVEYRRILLLFLAFFSYFILANILFPALSK